MSGSFPASQQYGLTGPPPPPPGAPGGSAAWTPPPPPPGSNPKGGNKVPLLVIGAIVGVVVLVAAGIGIVMAFGGDDTKAQRPTSTSKTPTKTSTSRSRTSPTSEDPTPANNPDSFGAKLMALIPSGYPTSVCEVASPPVTGSLATIDCRKSVQPNGPEEAHYLLFATQALLQQHFDEALKSNDEVLRCPGGDQDSPHEWHYDDESNTVGGQVACGTYKGRPDIQWSQVDDLMLADVQSSGDLGSLYDWWLNYS
jgi:serine/threonine-protein kinase